MFLYNQIAPDNTRYKKIKTDLLRSHRMNTYRVMLLLTVIFSSVAEIVENIGIDFVESNNQTYISELEKELLTQGFYFQYTKVDDEATIDLIMSFINFWKEKYNKKLSVCFVNKAKYDMQKDENMNLVLDFILKQGRIAKNLFLNDALIIDDLNCIAEKAVSDRILQILKGFGFDCEIFFYEVECILNGKFIFDYLFKSSRRFVLSNNVLYFYIAIKPTINIVGIIKEFKEYLESNTHEHNKDIEGQCVHLELPNDRFPYYSLTEIQFSKDDWLNVRWSNTGYLKGRLRFFPNENLLNLNEMRSLQISFGFNCFTLYVSFDDANNSSTERFNEETENIYNAKYKIEISTHSNDRKTDERNANAFTIILTDEIIISNTLGLQKILIFENFNYKKFYEYYYCFNPQKEGKIKTPDPKYAKYHRKFNYILNLFKANVEKCFKYRYYKKIHYFIKNMFWLENELYIAEGKRLKFISSIDIMRVNDINQKVVVLKSDLESYLKNRNPKIDFIQFYIKNTFNDFLSFYEIISESFTKYCTDLAISDHLKELNQYMPELGLRITTGRNTYINNFYLFIIPNFIFEFRRLTKYANISLCDKILEKIHLLKTELPIDIVESFISYITHEYFIEILDRHFFKCLFIKEYEIRRNIIREVFIESCLKILPEIKKKNKFELIFGDIRYLTSIEIIISVILNVFDTIKEDINKNLKNIECVVVFESEAQYLIGDYADIQEIIQRTFKPKDIINY